MSAPPRISVIIPTYQRRASLERTLTALAAQTIDAADYEVIVAIDGSDDGTRGMVAAFEAPYALTFIWQPNAGRAAARNAGIARARGELVVFFDDDMEPVPACLAAHLEAHPPGARRAVVGPVPIPVNPADPPVVEYRRRTTDALLQRLGQPGYQPGFRDMYTGNLSVRRDVLEEVGAFDASFTLYGHEDYEIALRFAAAGVSLGYCPAAIACQRYEKDFPGLARDCIARGHTAVLFARKHPDAAAGLRLGSYADGSRKWRLVRGLLLALSATWPGLPDRIIELVTWLERRRPPRLDKYYALTIDYLFWLGVRTAGAVPGVPASRGAAVRPTMGVAAGLLVLFALSASVRMLGRALRDRPAITHPDEITRYESRFHELRQVLSPHRQVGYIADSAPDPSGSGDSGTRTAFKHYLLTQYAVLPTLLVPDARQPLVIGNFEREIDSAVMHGLTPVRDFGNGVILLRTLRE
jgi:glycosyltransferase involved in cell wall biosynthesis